MTFYDILGAIYFFVGLIYVGIYITVKKKSQGMWGRVKECKKVVRTGRYSWKYVLEVTVNGTDVTVDHLCEPEQNELIMIYKYKEKYFTDYYFFHCGTLLFQYYLVFFLAVLFVYCYR